jgi:hypothetical protein
MDTFEQVREGELRTDQLEIGKIYRVECYKPDQTLKIAFLGNVRDNRFGIINLVQVAPRAERGKERYYVPFDTKPNPYSDNWRFFQTAQDRLVTPFKQQALQEVFSKRVDPATAWGLTKDFLAPSKKSGGRKYKTRQIKLRRKNRTRKNRRRTYRR